MRVSTDAAGAAAASPLFFFSEQATWEVSPHAREVVARGEHQCGSRPAHRSERYPSVTRRFQRIQAGPAVVPIATRE